MPTPMRNPSGETATGAQSFALWANDDFSGGKIEERITWCPGTGLQNEAVPSPASSAATAITVVNQPVRPLALPNFAAAASSCEPLSLIHFSSLAKSLALCHRSSGTFARHLLME